jgi:glutamate--cysteine ligase
MISADNLSSKDNCMTDLLQRRLKLLASDAPRALLRTGLRGIERETLRVDRHGHLALTPHPPALGAALTHPSITTDFAEPLLELITAPEQDSDAVLAALDAIHRFVHASNSDELLWNQSMPCRLPAEQDIPIARYGSSREGMFKHLYRQGLAQRYGRTMQCIAGIHYNFSLNESLWPLLQALDHDGGSPQDYRSAAYMGLIRNFHRYGWLLAYLFGASPACAADFLHGGAHGLQTLSDDTLYLPYATSLRMSDLGYRNSAQDDLVKSYNTLDGYLADLSAAIATPWPPYERIGTRRNGMPIQLNTNLLQIENEYYATIRPKRVPQRGQGMLEALRTQGIQYAEFRCMDINPFEPLGIDITTLRFLDLFAHFCALQASAPADTQEQRRNEENFSRAVNEGRRPGLMLQAPDGATTLAAWGRQLIDLMQPLAELFDTGLAQPVHAQALEAQRQKLADPELTPSARVLQGIRDQAGSFAAFNLGISERQAAGFRSRPPSPDQQQAFAAMATDSLRRQQELESAGRAGTA